MRERGRAGGRVGAALSRRRAILPNRQVPLWHGGKVQGSKSSSCTNPPQPASIFTVAAVASPPPSSPPVSRLPAPPSTPYSPGLHNATLAEDGKERTYSFKNSSRHHRRQLLTFCFFTTANKRGGGGHTQTRDSRTPPTVHNDTKINDGVELEGRTGERDSRGKPGFARREMVSRNTIK